MNAGMNGWAGKSALVAGGSGAALSLWWCFLGPNGGWGLWAPVAAGPLLCVALRRLGSVRARRWKLVRTGESAGMAAHLSYAGESGGHAPLRLLAGTPT